MCYTVEQPPDHAHSIKRKQHWIVWKCLPQTESWVAGYWQNCKSKGVSIWSFIFLPHMSFPRSLKPNLILLSSIYIFSQFGQFLATAICAQLSLSPHVFTSAPGVLSVMPLAVVCLPSLLPSSCTCSKVPYCGSEAQLQHFESLSPGSQVFGLWRECM